MTMKRRTHATSRRLVVPVLLAVVGLAGCGDLAPPDQDPELKPTTSASPGGTSTSATVSDGGTTAPPPPQAEFPLVLERTGGVAGYQDRVSFEADGTVRVSTGRRELTCTLEPATRERLTGLIAEAEVTEVPPSPSSDDIIADQMFQTVSWAGQTTDWNNPGVNRILSVAVPVFNHVTGSDPSEPRPDVTCPGAPTS